MKTRIMILLGVLMAVLTACQKKQPSEQKKAQLRINMKEEPCWMDPRKGVDMIASQLHFMAFEGLYRLRSDLSLRPGIAKSHEISEDGTIYTFHLRDANWSDGTKITAYDFEKTWKTILHPSFPSRDSYLLYPIKNARAVKMGKAPLETCGIQALDEMTFQVELNSPYPSFLQITALSFLVPINQSIDAKNPNWSHDAGSDFICNGPFKLTKWEHNNEMVFEKNPEYWRKDEIKLDSVYIHMIANEMSALRMYASGYFDVLGAPLSPFPVSSYPEMIEQGLIQTVPIAGTKILSYNIHEYPLNNVHIRRALTFAINRKSIVSNITHLNEEIATRAIPSVLDREKEVSFLKDNDDERAKEELALGLEELGITLKEFPKISFTYWSNDVNNLLAQQMQQKWKKVLGIDIDLDKVDFKTILAKTQDHTYSISLVAYIAEFPDAINIFERFKDASNYRNYPRWENSEYTALFEKAAFSMNDREEAQRAMEKILMEELPFAPLYHYSYAFLVQPSVKNFKISPLGHILFDEISLE